MVISREFFTLQFHFARRVVALSRRPLEEVLLDFTNFYSSFGHGRDFNRDNPVWLEYLHGFELNVSPDNWTYQFYLAGLSEAGGFDENHYFGCFYYRREGETILAGFENRDTVGPLSPARLPQREAELKEMLGYIRQHESDATTFQDSGWLLNLESYCLLLPPACLETAQPALPDYRSLTTWGQFLDHNGKVKPELAQKFVEKVEEAQAMPDLPGCFPYQPLSLEAPLALFYEHYGI